MALVRVDQQDNPMRPDDPNDPQQKWNFDEFHQMRMARFITSFEAFLSVYGHSIIDKSHQVIVFFLFKIYFVG